MPVEWDNVAQQWAPAANNAQRAHGTLNRPYGQGAAGHHYLALRDNPGPQTHPHPLGLRAGTHQPCTSLQEPLGEHRLLVKGTRWP